MSVVGTCIWAPTFGDRYPSDPDVLRPTQLEYGRLSVQIDRCAPGAELKHRMA